MADQIKVNYEALEEMAALCQKNSENLEATLSRIKEIANGMTTEALVGDVGMSFSEALLGPLHNSTKKLSDKFIEVAGDIRGAMEDMRDADETARAGF